MELKICDINKSFKNKKVLNNISFTIQSGQAMGYLGRNGAGKTTTIRILTDIFKSDSGEILLDGRPLNHKKVRMGYLPEERGLYSKVKVGEQMIFIGRLRGMDANSAKKKAKALLEELGADEYWGRKLDTLSKGNQQKVQLAIAMLHDPDVVILDEPFSGLDPVNAQVLKDLINKEVNKGKIVLFSSHQMSYVEEFCAHICIINQGEIVLDGKIKDIKKTYPRNRISITTEKSAEVSTSFLSDICEQVNVDAESIEVVLKDANEKEKLIAALTAHEIKIESFNVIEPSLQDIFVEYTIDGSEA